MRKMNKDFGTTFVIITHDTEFIQPNDKVIMLKDGKIQENKIEIIIIYNLFRKCVIKLLIKKLIKVKNIFA